MAKDDRHERETSAKIGKMFGVSRESMRKAGIAKRTFIDAQELIEKGEASVDELYKLAKGDNRVGLHVKIAPILRERLKAEAKAHDMTMSELVEAILTQIFGEGD
jgi:hypothetical protein